MSALPSPEFLRVLKAHDDLLRHHAFEISIGAEPTFTLASSTEPEWMSEAQVHVSQSAKHEHARRIVRSLAEMHRAVWVSEIEGRVYPGETSARFAYAVVFSRQFSEYDASDQALLQAEQSLLHPCALPQLASHHAILTVTPDPGVVEVNMAPASDISEFYSWCLRVYASAYAAGLSAIRYRFNGDVSDSGGGGQLTFGHLFHTDSPFFKCRSLLPSLLRYLNHHPSLSYFFGMDCLGSASQGPRPDEGSLERFEELNLALRWLDALERKASWSPTWLQDALGALLVDASGNSHRAELNIEKLWNPAFGERGTLGVVEFRALRMPPTPEKLTAIAVLFRSILARLMVSPFRCDLIDWGRDLHHQFALPTVQLNDLREVFADLRRHGFALDSLLEEILVEQHDPIAVIRRNNEVLTVRHATEFWPLLGDVASQERHGARWVDASSARFEILLESCVDAHEHEERKVTVNGWSVPMLRLGDRRWIVGIRSRVYEPKPGYHPMLRETHPLSIDWNGARLVVHGWKTSGGPYDGLPNDADEALSRRIERISLSDNNLVASLPKAETILMVHRSTADIRYARCYEVAESCLWPRESL